MIGHRPLVGQRWMVGESTGRPRPRGGSSMRLPKSAHTSQPWLIHDLTRDFRLEDVWALPRLAHPDDFPLLVETLTSLDPSHASSRIVRALFAIRWEIGGRLGWDGTGDGIGARVPPLRDRLPAYLRAAAVPRLGALPITPMYLLDDEWAAELANRTMHGVIHVGRVSDDAGGWRGQMAILVKPNGLFGHAYMAAIRPFRYLLVY